MTRRSDMRASEGSWRSDPRSSYRRPPFKNARPVLPVLKLAALIITIIVVVKELI